MGKGTCGCKHKGKKHVHKEPGDGLYKEFFSTSLSNKVPDDKFWEN